MSFRILASRWCKLRGITNPVNKLWPVICGGGCFGLEEKTRLRGAPARAGSQEDRDLVIELMHNLTGE